MEIRVYFWALGEPETELLVESIPYTPGNKSPRIFFDLMDNATVHVTLQRSRTVAPLGSHPAVPYPATGQKAYITFQIPLSWKTPHIMLMAMPRTCVVACTSKLVLPQLLSEDCLGGNCKLACYIPLLMPTPLKPAKEKITGAAGFLLH